MTVLPVEIVIPADPSDADRDAILRPLLAFNEAKGGPAKHEPFAVLLRDPLSGTDLGGLWGQLYYNWLFVELIFVPEHLRGSGAGSQLIAMAEDFAHQKNCTGVWLDTFSFQAPDFYRKLGYAIFGTLDAYPTGHKRFFLRKRFKE